MISELSALVLALRYRLEERDYLTIDEPEAHLHPEMQIDIAKHLVKLAASGLGITLTTHSSYFVEQVNNAIRSSELAMAIHEEEASAILPIDRQRVQALLFLRETDGCTAVSAIGDLVDPVREDPFTQTSRRQYDESIPLISRLIERQNLAAETQQS